LAAVTTLIASEEEREQVRKAGLMGFTWGHGPGAAEVRNGPERVPWWWRVFGIGN